MKEIPLTRGKVAVVDDDDYALVSDCKWYAVQLNKKFYAGSYVVVDGKTALILMHRLIVGLAPGKTPEVDHKDGDGLNNRRENLRKVTHAQNMANRKKHCHSKQPYKGIFLFKETSRWRARIRVSGKTINIGTYDTPEEAAFVYDTMARKVFGEYARLNFPNEAPRPDLLLKKRAGQEVTAR